MWTPFLGLPGDGINGVFESLRTHSDKLRFIQVRHEEAAAFAACGYAEVHQEDLGVLYRHVPAPEASHLANGPLRLPRWYGQPVLAITGPHVFMT